MPRTTDFAVPTPPLPEPKPVEKPKTTPSAPAARAPAATSRRTRTTTVTPISGAAVTAKPVSTPAMPAPVILPEVSPPVLPVPPAGVTASVSRALPELRSETAVATTQRNAKYLSVLPPVAPKTAAKPSVQELDSLKLADLEKKLVENERKRVQGVINKSENDVVNDTIRQHFADAQLSTREIMRTLAHNGIALDDVVTAADKRREHTSVSAPTEDNKASMTYRTAIKLPYTAAERANFEQQTRKSAETSAGERRVESGVIDDSTEITATRAGSVDAKKRADDIVAYYTASGRDPAKSLSAAELVGTREVYDAALKTAKNLLPADTGEDEVKKEAARIIAAMRTRGEIRGRYSMEGLTAVMKGEDPTGIESALARQDYIVGITANNQTLIAEETPAAWVANAALGAASALGATAMQAATDRYAPKISEGDFLGVATEAAKDVGRAVVGGTGYPLVEAWVFDGEKNATRLADNFAARRSTPEAAGEFIAQSKPVDQYDVLTNALWWTTSAAAMTGSMGFEIAAPDPTDIPSIAGTAKDAVKGSATYTALTEKAAPYVQVIDTAVKASPTLNRMRTIAAKVPFIDSKDDLVHADRLAEMAMAPLDKRPEVEAALRKDAPELMRHVDRMEIELGEKVLAARGGVNNDASIRAVREVLSPSEYEKWRLIGDMAENDAIAQYGMHNPALVRRKQQSPAFAAMFDYTTLISSLNEAYDYVRKTKVNPFDFVVARAYAVLDEIPALKVKGKAPPLSKVMLPVLSAAITKHLGGVVNVDKKVRKAAIANVHTEVLAALANTPEAAILQQPGVADAFKAASTRALAALRKNNDFYAARKVQQMRNVKDPATVHKLVEAAIGLRAEIRGTAAALVSAQIRDLRVSNPWGKSSGTMQSVASGEKYGVTVGRATSGMDKQGLRAASKDVWRALRTGTQPLTPLGQKYAAQLQEAFKLSETDARSAAFLMDTRAMAWATATGRPVDMWYASRIDSITRGQPSKAGDVLKAFDEKDATEVTEDVIKHMEDNTPQSHGGNVSETIEETVAREKADALLMHKLYVNDIGNVYLAERKALQQALRVNDVTQTTKSLEALVAITVDTPMTSNMRLHVRPSALPTLVEYEIMPLLPPTLRQRIKALRQAFIDATHDVEHAAGTFGTAQAQIDAIIYGPVNMSLFRLPWMRATDYAALTDLYKEFQSISREVEQFLPTLQSDIAQPLRFVDALDQAIQLAIHPPRRVLDAGFPSSVPSRALPQREDVFTKVEVKDYSRLPTESDIPQAPAIPALTQASKRLQEQRRRELGLTSDDGGYEYKWNEWIKEANAQKYRGRRGITKEIASLRDKLGRGWRKNSKIATISDGEYEVIQAFLDIVGPDRLADIRMVIRNSDFFKRPLQTQPPLGVYNFAEDIVGISYRAVANGDFAPTVVHELWHSLSRYIPDDVVKKLYGQYVDERESFMRQNPGAFNTNGVLTELNRARGQATYRYTSFDEWVVEKMTDLAIKDAAEKVRAKKMPKLASIFTVAEPLDHVLRVLIDMVKSTYNQVKMWWSDDHLAKAYTDFLANEGAYRTLHRKVPLAKVMESELTPADAKAAVERWQEFLAALKTGADDPATTMATKAKVLIDRMQKPEVREAVAEAMLGAPSLKEELMDDLLDLPAIPDEMTDVLNAVNNADALDASKGTTVLASVEFLANDGKALIKALSENNPNVAVHELAHIFRRDLPPAVMDEFCDKLKIEYGIDVTYDSTTNKFVPVPPAAVTPITPSPVGAVGAVAPGNAAAEATTVTPTMVPTVPNLAAAPENVSTSAPTVPMGTPPITPVATPPVTPSVTSAAALPTPAATPAITPPAGSPLYKHIFTMEDVDDSIALARRATDTASAVINDGTNDLPLLDVLSKAAETGRLPLGHPLMRAYKRQAPAASLPQRMKMALDDLLSATARREAELAKTAQNTEARKAARDADAAQKEAAKLQRRAEQEAEKVAKQRATIIGKLTEAYSRLAKNKSAGLYQDYEPILEEMAKHELPDTTEKFIQFFSLTAAHHAPDSKFTPDKLGISISNTSIPPLKKPPGVDADALREKRQQEWDSIRDKAFAAFKGEGRAPHGYSSVITEAEKYDLPDQEAFANFMQWYYDQRNTKEQPYRSEMLGNTPPTEPVLKPVEPVVAAPQDAKLSADEKRAAVIAKNQAFMAEAKQRLLKAVKGEGEVPIVLNAVAASLKNYDVHTDDEILNAIQWIYDQKQIDTPYTSANLGLTPPVEPKRKVADATSVVEAEVKPPKPTKEEKAAAKAQKQAAAAAQKAWYKRQRDIDANKLKRQNLLAEIVKRIPHLEGGKQHVPMVDVRVKTTVALARQFFTGENAELINDSKKVMEVASAILNSALGEASALHTSKLGLDTPPEILLPAKAVTPKPAATTKAPAVAPAKASANAPAKAPAAASTPVKSATYSSDAPSDAPVAAPTITSRGGWGDQNRQLRDALLDQKVQDRNNTDALLDKTYENMKAIEDEYGTTYNSVHADAPLQLKDILDTTPWEEQTARLMRAHAEIPMDSPRKPVRVTLLFDKYTGETYVTGDLSSVVKDAEIPDYVALHFTANMDSRPVGGKPAWLFLSAKLDAAKYKEKLQKRIQRLIGWHDLAQKGQLAKVMTKPPSDLVRLAQLLEQKPLNVPPRFTFERVNGQAPVEVLPLKELGQEAFVTAKMEEAPASTGNAHIPTAEEGAVLDEMFSSDEDVLNASLSAGSKAPVQAPGEDDVTFAEEIWAETFEEMLKDRTTDLNLSASDGRKTGELLNGLSGALKRTNRNVRSSPAIKELIQQLPFESYGDVKPVGANDLRMPLTAPEEAIREDTASQSIYQGTHKWSEGAQNTLAFIIGIGGDENRKALRSVTPETRVKIMGGIRPLQEATSNLAKLLVDHPPISEYGSKLEYTLDHPVMMYLTGRTPSGTPLKFTNGNNVPTFGGNMIREAMANLRARIDALSDYNKQLLLTVANQATLHATTVSPNAAVVTILRELEDDAMLTAGIQALHFKSLGDGNAIPLADNWRLRVIHSIMANIPENQVLEVFAAPFTTAPPTDETLRYSALLFNAYGRQKIAATQWVADGLAVTPVEAEDVYNYLNGRAVKNRPRVMEIIKQQGIIAGENLFAPLDESVRIPLRDAAGNEVIDKNGRQIMTKALFTRQARDKMGAAMVQAGTALSDAQKSRLRAGESLATVRRSSLLESWLGYIATDSTSGAFMTRPEYFPAALIGDISQMALHPQVGLADSAKQALRLIPQLMITNTPLASFGSLLLGMGAGVGVVQGKAVETLRRKLQTVGDKLNHLLSVGRHSISVNSVMDGTTAVVGRTPYTGEYLRKVAIKHGVYANFDASIMANAMVNSATDVAGSLTRNFIDGWRQHIREYAEGATIRNRVTLYVSLVENGVEPERAAKETAALLFDYANTMTEADRNMLIRVFMPYWVWRKNNARLVIDSLADGSASYKMRRLLKIERAGEYAVEQMLEEFNEEDELGIKPSAMDAETRSVYYAVLDKLRNGYGSVETWDDTTKGRITAAFQSYYDQTATNPLAQPTFEDVWQIMTTAQRDSLQNGTPNLSTDDIRALKAMFGAPWAVGQSDAQLLPETRRDMAAINAATPPDSPEAYLHNYAKMRPKMALPPSMTEGQRQARANGVPMSTMFIVGPENFALSYFQMAAHLAGVVDTLVVDPVQAAVDPDTTLYFQRQALEDDIAAVIDPERAMLLGDLISYINDDVPRFELEPTFGAALYSLAPYMVEKMEGKVDTEGKVLAPTRYALTPSGATALRVIPSPAKGMLNAWRAASPMDKTTYEYHEEPGSYPRVTNELLRQTRLFNVTPATVTPPRGVETALTTDNPATVVGGER